jgi:hypothetical protein
VQRDVDAVLVAEADQHVVDAPDVVAVTREGRAQDRGDADRVLVDVGLDVLGADDVLVGMIRGSTSK